MEMKENEQIPPGMAKVSTFSAPKSTVLSIEREKSIARGADKANIDVFQSIVDIHEIYVGVLT